MRLCIQILYISHWTDWTSIYEIYKQKFFLLIVKTKAEIISEIAGMFAADGFMQKNYLCMWGNIYQDKEYYDNIVNKFFKKAFNVNLRLHEKKSNSVYGFYLCNRNIINYFNKTLGFTIGNKTYTVSAPKSILNNPKYYAVFIRGFVDCDGCLNNEFHPFYLNGG